MCQQMLLFLACAGMTRHLSYGSFEDHVVLHFLLPLVDAEALPYAQNYAMHRRRRRHPSNCWGHRLESPGFRHCFRRDPNQRLLPLEPIFLVSRSTYHGKLLALHRHRAYAVATCDH